MKPLASRVWAFFESAWALQTTNKINRLFKQGTLKHKYNIFHKFGSMLTFVSEREET